MAWHDLASQAYAELGQSSCERILAEAYQTARTSAERAVVSNLTALSLAQAGDYAGTEEYWSEAKQLWGSSSDAEKLEAATHLSYIISRQVRGLIDPYGSSSDDHWVADASEDTLLERCLWSDKLNEGFELLERGQCQVAGMMFDAAAQEGGVRGVLALNCLALSSVRIGDYAAAAEIYKEVESGWQSPGAEDRTFLSERFRARGWERSAACIEEGRPVSPWVEWSRDLGLQPEGQAVEVTTRSKSWYETLEEGLVLIAAGDGAGAARILSRAQHLAGDMGEKCVALNAEAWASCMGGDYMAAEAAWEQMCGVSSLMTRDSIHRYLEILTRAGLENEAELVRQKLAAGQAPLIDPWRDFTASQLEQEQQAVAAGVDSGFDQDDDPWAEFADD